MKYKAGDRVKIKSNDFFNKNKGNLSFYVDSMALCFSNEIVTIKSHGRYPNTYRILEDEGDFLWTDEMIEELVEEEAKNNNDMKGKETLLGWIKESDNLRLVPHKDYEIKHDGDNFYLVKKKKEYPKTYEECCRVLGIDVRDLDILDNMLDASEMVYRKNLDRLLNSFRKLLICRDAYWKIAGEEMGLEKPWKPNDSSGYCTYAILRHTGHIRKSRPCADSVLLEFPTEEMRDTFYENFKELIEQCKELL